MVGTQQGLKPQAQMAAVELWDGGDSNAEAEGASEQRSRRPVVRKHQGEEKGVDAGEVMVVRGCS